MCGWRRRGTAVFGARVFGADSVKRGERTVFAVSGLRWYFAALKAHRQECLCYWWRRGILRFRISQLARLTRNRIIPPGERISTGLWFDFRSAKVL